MKIDRNSIAYRLIMPIFCAIALIAVMLLVFINHITDHILDDYHHLVSIGWAEETKRLLDSAMTELTNARLLNNPTVVEAKQQALVEAVDLSWKRQGIGGIIAAKDGAVLRTTLPPDITALFLAKTESGYVAFKDKKMEYYGQAIEFHPWGWRVVTINTSDTMALTTKGVFLLMPVSALASLVMATVFFVILRRNLQRPVAQLVNAVSRQEPVAVTGVTELDSIGNAFNQSLAQIQEWTEDLATELTERKKAEQALIAEKNKFEAIIAAMGDGVSIQDRNFTILFQNQVHQGFVGNHIGETCYKAYPHRDEVCNDCPIALAFEDGKIHTVQRTIKHSGGTRHFEIAASPLRDGSGAIVAGIELVRDVTTRRQAEDHLRQAQKMEGIGNLAGGIAHDFNNVLGAVAGYTELLRRSLPDNAKLHDYVNQIDVAVNRGATITRQILAFSRKQEISLELLNLNELVAALQKMLRRLVREDIDIRLHLPTDSLLVKADASQLDQILINLTTNASDAMPHGGTLSFTLEGVHIDEAFIEAHGFGTMGPYALLTVADTGVGMEAAVKERIFEPFYTTKEVGKGTGLGLSTVYGIVKKHDGFINVYSELGLGSVFRIYLPLAQESAATAEEEQAGVTMEFPGGAETILIAEDEDNLRLLLREIMEMVGYTVIEAVDGEEALAMFAARPDDIHLAMLDGIMPRKNGKQALVKMRELRPDLKAILLSGYAQEIFTQDELAELKVDFIPKPIYPVQLLKKVRKILDA